MDDVSLGKSCCDITHPTMQLEQDVSLGMLDARFRALMVDDGGVRAHRFIGVEHRWQNLVFHFEFATTFLGGRFTVGDHRGDPLPDESDNIVQHIGIVG